MLLCEGSISIYRKQKSVVTILTVKCESRPNFVFEALTEVPEFKVILQRLTWFKNKVKAIQEMSKSQRITHLYKVYLRLIYHKAGH